jgi:hypothetical protein
MIAMSVRDQNGMHGAESRVRRAGNGVAGIVKNAYARRVFEQDRPVLRAELAGTLSDRGDFDIGSLCDRTRASQRDQQTNCLELSFHSEILRVVEKVTFPAGSQSNVEAAPGSRLYHRDIPVLERVSIEGARYSRSSR